MHAAVIDRYGGPEELNYREIQDVAPVAGEVLIRVAGAGVNPVDLQDRAGGTKSWRPLEFPAIIGWDVSGTVEAVGADVQGFVVGDHVMAWDFNTYAELVAVKAELVAKVPRGISLIDAAAIPLAAMTGSQLVIVGANVQAGQTVIVSGAVGAVGRAAVFAAKDRGAHVIAAVRNSQMELANHIGADEVIGLDDVGALIGINPVDVVANTLRGVIAEHLLELVKQGGTFASVTGAPANATSRSDVKVVAFVSKQDTRNLEYVAAAVADGRLTLSVDQRLPMANAGKAHELMAAGGAGKIVLVP